MVMRVWTYAVFIDNIDLVWWARNLKIIAT